MPTLAELLDIELSGRFRAVVYDDWKLIWTPYQTPESSWELYDLIGDPDETTNVYRDGDPRVAVMKGQLRAWLERGASTPDGPGASESDLRALRALGYVE